MLRCNRFTLLPLTLLLCSCGGGGGGGGGGSSSSTTPPLSYIAPVTSVPAAVYSGSTATSKVSVFDGLKSFRSQATGQTGGGVGELMQDSALDVAAQAHADYLATNGIETHDEVATNAGFYATTPLARAQKAGMTGNAWVGESIGAASQCLQQLLGTVYHLQQLTGSAEHIGIGYNSTVCVVEEATLTGVNSSNAPLAGQSNAIPVWGGQQMPATMVAYSPANGSTVATTMSANEIPRAAPDLSNPGYPLMVRVRADSAGDVLTVISFTLSNSSGALPGELLIPGNAQSGSVTSSANLTVAVNGNIEPGVVFFIPQSPLVSGMTYTASFSGKRNGQTVSANWSFTSHNP